jgi:hypothetical protein
MTLTSPDADDSTHRLRFTVSVELVVEIEDPVTIATFLLAGLSTTDGQLALPTAEQPAQQIRQIIDETLRACLREHRHDTGLNGHVRSVTVYGPSRPDPTER